MNKLLYIVSILLGLINCIFNDDQQKNIIRIPLKRLQSEPWIKNNTESFCFSPKYIDSNYTYDFDIGMPQKCTGKQLIKIQNECVFQTISYQAEFYFDEKARTPFKLALDLRTPWSWLKSPVCRTFTRDGEEKSQSCNYYQDETKQWYNSTYDCQQKYCKKVQSRCGEIDFIQEGLSVIGQFVSTQIYFKQDKNFAKKPIKNWQILWAHGLSGHTDLEADGVLGLGLQHIQDNENISEEEYDNKEEDPNSYFEQYTDLWGAINNVYKKINADIFALYLAEHDSLKQTLLIGENVMNMTQYIHLPDKFQLKYTPLTPLKYTPDQEEYAKEYFQWKVPLRELVFRFDPIKKLEEIEKGSVSEVIIGYNNRTSIKLENEAQLSLQTSALILPQNIIDDIIRNMNWIFNLNCKLTTKFINYVQCNDMKSPLDVENLQLTIHLDSTNENEQVILYLNSQDLVLGCQKNKKKKYDCQLNIQLSYDDKIILGDSAFRNNFMVFDIPNRRIGFAPAKSIFNEKSLWHEFLDIINEMEDVIKEDIIFLIRFFTLVIISAIILFCFVNGQKVYKILQRKFRYKSVIDPSEIAYQNTNISIRRINSDDCDVIEQIQELEQDEKLDAL